MYEEHPDFEKPSDENAAIWRYLDFTKFVSLLDKRALFFAQAHTLPDSFEGSYPRKNVRLRPELHKHLPEDALDKFAFVSREIRRFTVLNCWHIGENESPAMWKLYLKTGEGVAIRSTFRRLADSFEGCVDRRVYIGKVKYVDYETDSIPEGNLLYPFVHKRMSFAHECELRAIIQLLPVAEGVRVDWTKELSHGGVYVPVDVDLLLESVFISPVAPSWFHELVSSVVARYGFNKEVRRSKLGEDPVY